MGGLTFATIASTAWGFAGRAAWAPPTFTTLSVLTLLAAIFFARQAGTFRLQPLLPALVLVVVVGISLLNRSHLPVPERPGSWIANPDWIGWLPATVDRPTTLDKMLPWLSALLLGAAWRMNVVSVRARTLLWAILVGHGVVLALAGIYFQLATPHEVLGLFRDRHGYHFASFIYRNHWAAYVLLLVPTALGFSFAALWRWLQRRGRGDAILPGLGAALLLGFTPIIPGSRSGMIILTAVLLIAVFKLARGIIRSRTTGASPGHRHWRLAALACFTALVVLALAPLLGPSLHKHWQRTLHQTHALLSGQDELRFQLTRDTLAMAAQRPVWGWGVGSYAHVFPVFQGDYLRDDKGRISSRLVHAHNDWAQVLAEMGIVGFLVLLWPVLRLLRRAWQGREEVTIWWVTAGLGLVLLYAMVDFPLHSPAVLLLFTTLLCTAAPPAPINPAPIPFRSVIPAVGPSDQRPRCSPPAATLALPISTASASPPKPCCSGSRCATAGSATPPCCPMLPTRWPSPLAR